MLYEKQPAARLENPAHLAQRRDRVCDRAESPSHHNRIKDRICKGKLFRRGRQKRYWGACGQSPLARQPQQFERGVNRNDLCDRQTIERQIQPRPDPDLEHKTSCCSDRLSAIRAELAVPHRPIEQTGQYQRAINAQL